MPAPAHNIQTNRHPLSDGNPPSWASAWGEDQFGPWVEISVDNKNGQPVVQRLRWIKPGEFTMGSPDDEPGRWGDEGPQHRVLLTEGYWLFDTPVTQALWQAVMSENPSEFQSPDRPVEKVSWKQAKTFLDTLNEQLPDLNLSLPSEAQWEYACRAGTQTAFYNGEFGDPKADRPKNLDEIAWFDANSREDMNLEGHDQGTHPVKQKKPNQWGLYDILGNVWEWCEDGRRDYEPDRIIDPVGPPPEAVAGRVVRGGSWSNDARPVRCAARGRDFVVYRYDLIGFRPARVQVRSGSEAQARSHRARIELARSAKAEAGTHGGAVSGVVHLNSRSDDEETRLLIPKQRKLVIKTDRGQLRMQQITKPNWAKEMGRDQFGLWLDFEVEANEQPVRQRMRWIPPGEFLMGSPEDEPGFESMDGPQHRVIVHRGYWLFDTPVTQAMWQTVMGENPSEFQSPDRPVENVSWDDSTDFLEKLNKQIPSLGLSLPSEAQWEYACRAGTQTAFYNGEYVDPEASRPANLDEIAWFDANSREEMNLEGHNKGTHPVKQKKPNRWGLYDMLGNVWEWCEDDWHDSLEGAPSDAVAWTEQDRADANRVIRGGSWGDDARGVRCAARDRDDADLRRNYFGFRPARVQA